MDGWTELTEGISGWNGLMEWSRWSKWMDGVIERMDEMIGWN